MEPLDCGRTQIASFLGSMVCLQVRQASIGESGVAGESRQKRILGRRERGKQIRMGAQAIGRAREALRPCGLFVSSLECQAKKILSPSALRAQNTLSGFPVSAG
jgi:hypothetical protein